MSKKNALDAWIYCNPLFFNMFQIYYQTVKGTKVGPLLAREPHINDAEQLRVKLAGLEPATKYRIHIKATTAAGEGEGFVFHD